MSTNAKRDRLGPFIGDHGKLEDILKNKSLWGPVAVTYSTQKLRTKSFGCNTKNRLKLYCFFCHKILNRLTEKNDSILQFLQLLLLELLLVRVYTWSYTCENILRIILALELY